VPWTVPELATVLFGTSILFVFTSDFTYLIVVDWPIATSVLASNSFIRSSFGFAFPWFAGAMYERLGTAGATALLAGLTTVIAPLPRIDARLRQSSRFAAS
ncbi:hypothetical protein CONPUDRAFT_58506, partial [Coniophora puteana RWD-64-598 SS2]